MIQKLENRLYLLHDIVLFSAISYLTLFQDINQCAHVKLHKMDTYWKRVGYLYYA